jgi:predicted membrane protein
MQKNLLCMPALLYVIFASVQIIFDLFNEMLMLAITKIFVAIIFTFVLNMLCVNGLSMISWFLILIPFIFTLLLVEILIFILGVKNIISEPIKKEYTNNKNNNRQFIDISYSETPHLEELVHIGQVDQIDDFNQIDME